MLRRQHDLPTSRRTVLTGQPVSARRSGLPRLRRAQRRGAQRRGFTLVEMMVAVVVLAVGLLGLTTTGAYVVRMVSGGQKQTLAATVAQSRLEQLRSLPCNSISNGEATTRGIREKWVKGSTNNQILFVTDSVRYSVSGSPRLQVYTLTIPCW